MYTPCKHSTVSTHHASSGMCDLSQLTEVVFVIWGILPDKTLHYSLTETVVRYLGNLYIKGRCTVTFAMVEVNRCSGL